MSLQTEEAIDAYYIRSNVTSNDHNHTTSSIANGLISAIAGDKVKFVEPVNSDRQYSIQHVHTDW